MEFHEFEIGKEFYTATGKWIVIDKGTRTIIACQEYDPEPEWDLKGSNTIFYPYDFGGCSLDKNEFD